MNNLGKVNSTLSSVMNGIRIAGAVALVVAAFTGSKVGE